jgi:aerotaxis receptor
VAEGSEQTRSASAAMGEARKAVEQVHEFIQQISLGMKEQMLGVSQVNQAVAEMDTMTQKNAALVEEVAASASTLNDKTSQVADSVGVFRLSSDPSKLADAVELRKSAKAGQKAQDHGAAHEGGGSGTSLLGKRKGQPGASPAASGYKAPATASHTLKRPAASVTKPGTRPTAPKANTLRPEPAMAEASADGDWDTF